MPRVRSPNRDKAFEIFKGSEGKKPLVEIAEELGISEGTVRGWKNKDKWNDKLNGTFPKKEGNVPNNTERSNKGGAPKGNQNALNNRGGAKKDNANAKGNKGGSAPANNKNAVTHGLYATIVYEHLSDEDKVLFDLSQDIEGQDQELQVARFKLAKLMGGQDTDAINKALDMISKIETRISKAKIEREKLQAQLVKMKAETQFIEERTKLIKGTKKDTTLMDALINVVNGGDGSGD